MAEVIEQRRLEFCPHCAQPTGRTITLDDEPRPCVGEDGAPGCVDLPAARLLRGDDNIEGRRDALDGYDGEDDETYDDAEDERPRCLSCGSMDFTVLVHRHCRASGDNEEYTDSTLYFDAYEYDTEDIHRTSCRDCGAQWHGEVDYV